jgi:hypothetical protein
MMLPEGAIRRNSVCPVPVCQKEANDCGGGEQDTIAGVLTDTEVSLYSRGGELFAPGQVMEQVADEPTAEGGV